MRTSQQTTPLVVSPLFFVAGLWVHPPKKQPSTKKSGVILIEYLFDQDLNRVTAMIDPNGNRIDLSSDKITHSAGDTINFVRDSENRITSVTDGVRTVKYSYDGEGNLARVTDPEGFETKFRYGVNHYLEEIIDSRGVRAIKTIYDDSGRMKYQINANGDTLTYDHDLAAGKSSTTDFAGNKTEYQYDANGWVTMQVSASGDTTRFEYDANGNQTKKINPDGSFSSATFDRYGNELTSTDELGRKTTRTYVGGIFEASRLASETDALGRTTTYSEESVGSNKKETVTGPDGKVQSVRIYSPSGNLASETDALGRVTTYGYGGKGRLTSTTDPLGRTTRYILDDRGNTTAEISPAGDTTKFVYDLKDNRIMTISSTGDTSKTTYTSFGKPASQTDAKGNVTKFVYDNFGQMVKTIAPDSVVTEKKYDSRGNISQSTSALGVVTKFEYDADNHLTRTITPAGTESKTIYDERGRSIVAIGVRGDTTRYEYDAVGNTIKVTDPFGNATSYKYDAANRKTEMTDALGNTVRYSYDQNDRLTTTTFADGSTIRSIYDAAGQVTEQIDQAGNSTKFTYTVSGKLESVTGAMSEITRYGYDSEDNLSSQTDARGMVTGFGYDSLGREIAKRYPTVNGRVDSLAQIYFAKNDSLKLISGTDTTTVYYDSQGRENLRRFSSSGHSISKSYGKAGVLESVTDYRGTTTYSYDSLGRMAKVENPDGSWIRYGHNRFGEKSFMVTPFDSTSFGYDKAGRMISAKNRTGSVNYHYNAVGSRDSSWTSNGISTGYHYDRLNRLVAVNHYKNGTPVASFAYTLNSAGIRTSVTELDGSRVNYDYDDAYRLTRETRTGTNPYTISYRYDAVGNRTEMNRNGVVTSYSYNERDQLTAEISGTDTTRYLYDHFGRMISKVNGTDTTGYSWIDNDRMSSVTTSAGTVSYQYDFNGQRVAETVNGVTKRYLIDNTLEYGQVVAEYSSTDTVSYLFGFERVANSKGEFYLADGQNSVRMLTDTAGNVTDRYTYSGFGELVSHVGDSDNKYLYVGEFIDGNTGFSYNRARWYDPTNGRFVSVDPYAGDPMSPVSLHRYLYANASPVSFSDPSGNFPTMAELSTVMVISSILNVTVGVFKGETTFGAILENAVVGAVEGAAFAVAGGFALKIFTKYARAVSATKYLSILNRIKKLPGGQIYSGTNISSQFTIMTDAGEFLISSGLKDGAATGAMKHVVNEILKAGGKAGATELAEILAYKEIEAVLIKLTEEGVVTLGKKIYIQTSYKNWEIILGVKDGLVKVFHLVPKSL